MEPEPTPGTRNRNRKPWREVGQVHLTRRKLCQVNTEGHFYQITSEKQWCACTASYLCYTFVAYASYPGVRATSGPGTYREVCPGAVILYFQQLSFVWASGDYTNYSPYRTEAIVNSTQRIFVLEKQRRGVVEFLDFSKPSTDVTKIKFG